MIYNIQRFTEMPHVQLTPKSFIDLEFELHTYDSPQEFLEYIKDLLQGEHVAHKADSSDSLNRKEVNSLAHYFQNNHVCELTIKKHFGDETYQKFLQVIQPFL